MVIHRAKVPVWPPEETSDVSASSITHQSEVPLHRMLRLNRKLLVARPNAVSNEWQ